MRWLGLVVLLVPSLGLTEEHGRAPEEAEQIAQRQIAPKLDLMCGTHLEVRYDAGALRGRRSDTAARFASECSQPLRYLYHACQEGGARRTIQLAQLTRYECRLAPDDKERIAVDHGVITFVVRAGASDMSERMNNLAAALHAPSPFAVNMETMGGFSGDDSWRAFVDAAVPEATGDDFCVVDGKRIPLPPTGDPLAPPHVAAKCTRHGTVVTDLTADGTGFRTQLEGDETHMDRFDHGLLDGESLVRTQGVVIQRTLSVRGREVSYTSYYRTSGKLRTHHDRKGGGELSMDEAGGVTLLSCGNDAGADAILRGPCGFDGQRTTKIFETSKPPRVVVMKNGKVTREE